MTYEGPEIAGHRNRESLVERGPRILVELYAREEDVSSLGELRPGFEGHCAGDALIDTGALIGAVDSVIVERLQLLPVRDISIHTTGGEHEARTYIVGLRVSGMDVGAVELAAAPGLARKGFIALLGREFLADRSFLYDGRAGTFTVEI